MARRIHVPVLRIGDIPLDKVQTHHARDVLRLDSGTVVEVFDDAGATAAGVLTHLSTGESQVHVDAVCPVASGNSLQWTIAAAVPKGDRADWMVEKLSELGATAFIPLATARSVVLPEGKNKRERWTRIATEAAKQSRRAGVMRVEELTPLDMAIANASRARDLGAAAWFLTTEIPDAKAIAEVTIALGNTTALTMFIGPEGGWTGQEMAAFCAANILPVKLGATVLRIETAAVVAGAVIATRAA